MASVWYPKGKEALLGSLNLSTADLRVILVDTGQYTYNSAHDLLNDVAAGSRQAVSGQLQSVTVTDGVFDAADITITGGIAATVEALIVYEHTGNEATARLIVYQDGLSLPIYAGDIAVRWNASGIAAI